MEKNNSIQMTQNNEMEKRNSIQMTQNNQMAKKNSIQMTQKNQMAKKNSIQMTQNNQMGRYSHKLPIRSTGTKEWGPRVWQSTETSDQWPFLDRYPLVAVDRIGESRLHFLHC